MVEFARMARKFFSSADWSWMVGMRELKDRQRRALLAFEDKPTLRFHDLPPYVGRTTMAELVSMGLVEPADPKVGPYSKVFEWRRVS